MDITARIALVTGGTRGIGLAVAHGLGAAGAIVYVGSRDPERGRRAEKGLREHDIEAHWLPLDVRDGAAAAAVAARIADEHGRLDTLVNNAGVGGTSEPPSTTTVNAMRDTFETNVFGVLTVTNAVLGLLRRSAAARVVNVSTVIGSLTACARRSDPTGVFPPGVFPQLTDYASSKAALNSLTVLYANELADTGIRVNAVSPGFVATEINDFRGHLSPAQGARLIIRLATLTADCPTGTFAGEDGSEQGQEVPW